MAFYDIQRRADRDRLSAERANELRAVQEGKWPRDTNDEMRWSTPYAAPTRGEKADHAARMCQADLDYLKGVQARIEAGDDDLKGWEA